MNLNDVLADGIDQSGVALLRSKADLDPEVLIGLILTKMRDLRTLDGEGFVDGRTRTSGILDCKCSLLSWLEAQFSEGGRGGEGVKVELQVLCSRVQNQYVIRICEELHFSALDVDTGSGVPLKMADDAILLH